MDGAGAKNAEYKNLFPHRCLPTIQRAIHLCLINRIATGTAMTMRKG